MAGGLRTHHPLLINPLSYHFGLPYETKYQQPDHDSQFAALRMSSQLFGKDSSVQIPTFPAMHPLLSLTRPGNVLIATSSVWLGGWVAGASMSGSGIWLDGLAMGLLAAGGNLHNDIIDLPVDRINQPDRALPAGRISLRAVQMATGFLLLTAIVIGIVRGPTHLVFFSAIAVVLYVYNRWLKGLPIVGNLAVAALCGSAVILPMIDASLWPPLSQPSVLIPLAIFSVLFTWTRELIKDIEDMEGDAAVHLHTLPLLIGKKASLACARGLLTFSVLSVVAPSILGLYPLSFSFVAALLVLPVSILSFRALSWEKPKPRKAQSLIKLALIGGLVASIVVFRVIPHF